jgi:hypothetical protein
VTARHRPAGTPQGFLAALGLTLVLMLLVAGGLADRGGIFPLVVLGGSGLAVGALYLLVPHGPQFALSTANGLALYACLFTVLSRAGFPDARDWARPAAFLLPVLAFLLACWIRRGKLRTWTQGRAAADLSLLPRFARWLAATGAVGVVSLALPINRLDGTGQGVALLAAMAVIAGISAVSVGDVVRLLVDIAALFREVARRLARLVVPVAAYSSLWVLLVVVFGCLYRIADGLSRAPIFAGNSGPIRISFPDALHFSVVTLSGVGYGDILPVDNGIRLVASIEMLLAQLLLLFGFYEIMRGSRAGAPEQGEGSRPRTDHSASDAKPGHDRELERRAAAGE